MEKNSSWSRLFFAMGLLIPSADAARRFEIEGYVSLAVPAQGIYRIGQDSLSDTLNFQKSQSTDATSPRFLFKDPDNLLTTGLGGTRAFQAEAMTLVLEVVEIGTADVIECLLISVQPLASLSGSVGWQSRPDLFAGPPNTLYPSLDSPVFRELEFGLDDLDSDQDGTSNLKDAFPNDPTETRDTDGDLIGNNADPDDDNDLILDVYELENDLNPTSNDADEDLDGDRQSNFDEFVAGTSANNSSSFFVVRIDRATPTSNQWRLSFPVKAGRTYRLKVGESLDAPLSPVGAPVEINADGQQEILQSGTASRKFYSIEAKLTTTP